MGLASAHYFALPALVFRKLKSVRPVQLFSAGGSVFGSSWKALE